MRVRADPLAKDPMKTPNHRHPFPLWAAWLSAGLLSLPVQAIDVDAAKALHKKNDCGKCHAAEKEKKGPSLKKIADKYRGKPDGEEKAVKNMTSGAKVKLDDGTEEEHKIIKTTDPAELKNLAQWILSH
jgi:cytochrome c